MTRRHPLMTVVVPLLAIGNLTGLIIAFTRPEALTDPFPRLTLVWPIYVACPLVSLAALGALWQGRRWGLWLALTMAAVALAIELWASGPAPHVFRIPIAASLLVMAARLDRARLRF